MENKNFDFPPHGNGGLSSNVKDGETVYFVNAIESYMEYMRNKGVAKTTVNQHRKKQKQICSQSMGTNNK